MRLCALGSRERAKHLKFSLTLYFLQRSENRLLVGDGSIPFNDWEPF